MEDFKFALGDTVYIAELDLIGVVDMQVRHINHILPMYQVRCYTDTNERFLDYFVEYELQHFSED